MAKNEIVLIDGNSYIHRAFHAIKELRTSKGQPTNAVYGFTRMLDKVLKEKKPEYAVVVFDTGKPTFRHEKYPEYKIKRLKMPEDMVSQLPYIRQVVEAEGIPTLEMDGYEADDLIATICEWAKENGFRVTIVSSDKDLLQLVSSDVIMWDTMKNGVMDTEKVKRKYDVEPEKLLDLFALMGDSSDNVPGVPGVGPKGAAKLIKEFDTLESVLENAERVKNARIRENLKKFKDQAILSKELIKLNSNAPLELSFDLLKIRPPNYQRLAELFNELEFKSFLEQIPADVAVKTNKPKGTVKIVSTEKEFQHLIKEIQDSALMAFEVVTDNSTPMLARVIGIAVALREQESYYVPIAPNATFSCSFVGSHSIMGSLKPLLEDKTKKKLGHNLKFSLLALLQEKISLSGIDFDVMIASYLLDPGKNSYSLEALAKEFLDDDILSMEDIAGKGKKQISADKVALDKLAQYLGQRAEAVLRLVPVLKEKLESGGTYPLFEKIEMPLVNVLACMEKYGVLVDKKKLEDIAAFLERRLKVIEETIYEFAGERFNIQSPKQLREILFDKLNLPVIKKTKTGPSTDIEVLTVLSKEHPLPKAVVEYRSLAKLKSGYVDALPKLINPRTGRIHTSYNQTVTATGRLSSSDPNLQNIPIRTEEGKEIRSAFIAPPGYLLLSADYSQIELRILAHYSGDTSLVKAFEAGEDIHCRTASEVLGVPIDDVTPEMRRQAKVVNFGVIYGMSPYGLAKELGVTPAEAKDWIDNYFHRYEGVKSFIDQTISHAREKGYVETLWGRRRFVPEITSRNRNVRQFGERLAVNTPIQGSAADLIKSVMVRLHVLLKEKKFPATMILQVHDELVFEVKEGSQESLAGFLKKEMTAVKRLRVPLKVDIGWGKNWTEAHP